MITSRARVKILRSIFFRAPASARDRAALLVLALPMVTALASVIATPLAPTLEVAAPVLEPREVTTKVLALMSVTPV